MGQPQTLLGTSMEQNHDTNPTNIVGLSGTPGQGPFMAIAMKMKVDLVLEARYVTYGCVTSEMCGQWVCETIEGKSINEAQSLTADLIISAIGAMPLGREHCPGLAIDALRHGLNQYLSRG